jgi:hypothetical protein
MKADPDAAEAQLQTSMGEIVKATAGNRHAVINRKAYYMGWHVATGAIDRLRVIETLIAAAEAAGVGETRARDEACRGLADGVKAAPDRERWIERLEANEKGVPRSSYLNSIIALSESPAWYGCLGYSTRHARAEWLRTPPINGGYSTAAMGRPFRDEHAVVAAEWLSRKGMSFSRRAIIDTMLDVSQKQPFDPVCNILDELDWDGTERLSNFLVRYFGVPPDKAPWARCIGRKWLISAVARAYKPGCKADNILILEGEQGTRKSTALDVLGLGFTREIRVKLDDKDASDALHSGAWLAVLSELDSFKATARIEAIKAFLTLCEDYYRQAYARVTGTFQRSMVFAATTNEETYLNDPTGNRRFWPIGVGEIDLEGLRADVEQLWAEAVQAFRDGEPWHIEDPSERALAESEQRTRLLPDSWEVYVSEYVDGRDAVSLNDVLENALEIERSRQTPQSVARVTRYLRRLGYGSAIRKGKKVWVRVR